MCLKQMMPLVLWLSVVLSPSIVAWEDASEASHCLESTGVAKWASPAVFCEESWYWFFFFSGVQIVSLITSTCYQLALPTGSVLVICKGMDSWSYLWPTSMAFSMKNLNTFCRRYRWLLKFHTDLQPVSTQHNLLDNHLFFCSHLHVKRVRSG